MEKAVEPILVSILAIGIVVWVGFGLWATLAVLMFLCRRFPKYSQGLQQRLDKIDSWRWYTKWLIALAVSILIGVFVYLMESANPGWVDSL